MHHTGRLPSIDPQQNKVDKVEDHCVICLDTIEQPPPYATISLPCAHRFHWACFKQHVLRHAEQSTCPLCRRPLAIRSVDGDRLAYEQKDPSVSLGLCPEWPAEDQWHGGRPPNAFTLTLQTIDSEYATTLHGDALYVKDPYACSAPIIEYQQQFEMLPPLRDNNTLSERTQQRVVEEYGHRISYCTRCVLFTLNRCCECLAVGLLVGLTYSIIYIIKHTTRPNS